MFQFKTTNSIEEFANLLKNSDSTYAITGAGISTPTGIPDLAHLSQGSISISSENVLRSEPKKFYDNFHKLFIDPIFQNGPTDSHKYLAKMEEDGLIKGIVTTNVDYLHELAGSQNTADIWSSLNINHCLKCGRIFPIDNLKNAIPTCPLCGGILSPDPIYHHIGIDESEYLKANQWMHEADLVLTIGSNGYYDNIPQGTKVVNINPKQNYFDQRADLIIHKKADQVFNQLYDYL